PIRWKTLSRSNALEHASHHWNLENRLIGAAVTVELQNQGNLWRLSSVHPDTSEIDIRAAYEWLCQFLTQKDWDERRKKIQSHLLEVARPHDSAIGSEEFRSVSITDDRFGWYLYLAETYLHRPESYEVIQGARVMPILAQLGAHLELLQ